MKIFNGGKGESNGECDNTEGMFDDEDMDGDEVDE